MPGLMDLMFQQAARQGPLTYQDVILSMNPEGYWPLQEASGNFADVTGNGFTATVSGSPTYQQTGPTVNGVAQNAVYFDGTNDYATVDESIDDTTSTSTGMTIAFWWKVDSASTQTGAVVRKRVTDEHTWTLYYNGSGHDLDLYTYNTAGANHAAAWGSGDKFDDDEWHCFIGTVTPTDNYLNTYLDDSLYRNQTSTTGTWHSPTDADMGFSAAWNGDHKTEGTLCHIAYWPRVLTAAERTKFYTGVM